MRMYSQVVYQARRGNEELKTAVRAFIGSFRKISNRNDEKLREIGIASLGIAVLAFGCAPALDYCL